MKISTGRKFLAAFLLLPFVLWGISDVVGPDTGDGNSTADQLKALGKIADHKGAYVASNLLFVVGALIFILATYGIVHVYRGNKLGLGQVAGGLLAIGMSVFFAFYAFGATQYEMVNHAEFRTPATQHAFAQLLHFGNSSGPGSALFIAFILGIVLGPVLLGIAMIRRRNVPVWSGILTIVAGVVGFFVNSSAGNVIVMVLLLVALAPLAALIWSMSDAEWDAPRDVAGQRKTKRAPASPEPATPAAAPAV